MGYYRLGFKTLGIKLMFSFTNKESNSRIQEYICLNRHKYKYSVQLFGYFPSFGPITETIDVFIR